jgi:hypothetical protein
VRQTQAGHKGDGNFQVRFAFRADTHGVAVFYENQHARPQLALPVDIRDEAVPAPGTFDAFMANVHLRFLMGFRDIRISECLC